MRRQRLAAEGERTMAIEANHSTDIDESEEDLRVPRISAPVLVAGAGGVVLAAWVGLKILRFAMKVAGILGTVAALGGAVAYFVRRRDSGDDAE
jgi:hypothetical protein